MADTSFRYSVYGLALGTNRPIPELESSRSSVPIDVGITFRHPGADALLKTAAPAGSCYYESPESTKHGLTVSRLQDDHGKTFYQWTYRDGTHFLLDEDGSEIWVDWSDSETINNTLTYLLGPVLVFVLRLRGLVSLHASAVNVAGRAIALLGPPGAGKSTTVAGFALRGHALLTDDVATLTPGPQTFDVQPGYPRLRLWPDSADMLFGSLPGLPPVLERSAFWPEWNKRYVDLRDTGYSFQQAPLPLAAIYLLSRRDPTSLGPLRPSDGLLALTQNTYGNYLLNKGMRAQEFSVLARLATTVRLREVASPTSRRQLSKLCDTILEDVA